MDGASCTCILYSCVIGCDQGEGHSVHIIMADSSPDSSMANLHWLTCRFVIHANILASFIFSLANNMWSNRCICIYFQVSDVRTRLEWYVLVWMYEVTLGGGEGGVLCRQSLVIGDDVTSLFDLLMWHLHQHGTLSPHTIMSSHGILTNCYSHYWLSVEAQFIYLLIVNMSLYICTKTWDEVTYLSLELWHMIQISTGPTKLLLHVSIWIL